MVRRRGHVGDVREPLAHACRARRAWPGAAGWEPMVRGTAKNS